MLADPPVPGRAAVREERGQVVDAGRRRPDGDATGVFGGALRVGVDDLPALAAAARAAACRSPVAAPIGPAGDVGTAAGDRGAPGRRGRRPGSAVDRLVRGPRRRSAP